MRLRPAIACLAALLVAAGLPAAGQQQGGQRCGTLEWHLANPGIQSFDGSLRLSGQLFLQVRVLGDRAADVATVALSLGPETSDRDPAAACATNPPLSGVYLSNYRADRSGADGFFLPLQTQELPDGAYAAAFIAYDAGSAEIGRTWATAVVDNCDAEGPNGRCGADAEELRRHDRLAPWPIVLPGDGQSIVGPDGFTIEFPEPVGDVRVAMDGVDITGQLDPWTGRTWDSDLVPDYAPGLLSGAAPAPCSVPTLQSCEPYGPAFAWAARNVTLGQELRVQARDDARNLIVKTVRLGGPPPASTTLAPPLVQVAIPETRQETPPDREVRFTATLSNSGDATATVNLVAHTGAGWSVRWDPARLEVPGAASRTAVLTVNVPAGAQPALYNVTVGAGYFAGAQARNVTTVLDVTVTGERPPGGREAEGTRQPGDDGLTAVRDTPSPHAASLLAGLALAAFAALRRR